MEEHNSGDILQNASLQATAKPKPWMRGFARITDETLFSIVFIGGIALTVPSAIFTIDSIHDIIWAILMGLLFAFLESFLLSKWGTTPGKWMFGVELKLNQSLQNPNYTISNPAKKTCDIPFEKALKRSLHVFVEGIGLNIKYAVIPAMALSELYLRKNGVTRWDKKGGFTVTHKKMNASNYIAITATWITMMVIVFFALLAENDIAKAQKPCPQNNIEQCIRMGVVKYVNGFTKESYSDFKTACALRSVDACLWVADVQIIENNIADTFLDDQCKNNNYQACVGVSSLEVNIRKDLKKSNMLIEKSCDNGVLESCTDLALEMFQNRLGKQKEGLALIKKSCLGGEPYGCELMAYYVLDYPPANDELELLRSNCDKGKYAACHGLALTYDPGFKEKSEPSFSILENACKKGIRESCYHLSEYYEKNDPKNKALIEKACLLGHRTSCNEVESLDIKKMN